jgi:hypothetical protein
MDYATRVKFISNAGTGKGMAIQAKIDSCQQETGNIVPDNR